MQNSFDLDKPVGQPSPFEYDRVAYPGAADQSINLRNLEVTAKMFGAASGRIVAVSCA